MQSIDARHALPIGTRPPAAIEVVSLRDREDGRQCTNPPDARGRRRDRGIHNGCPSILRRCASKILLVCKWRWLFDEP